LLSAVAKPHEREKPEIDLPAQSFVVCFREFFCDVDDDAIANVNIQGNDGLQVDRFLVFCTVGVRGIGGARHDRLIKTVKLCSNEVLVISCCVVKLTTGVWNPSVLFSKYLYNEPVMRDRL
jgi:hypothetical protein